MSQTQAAIRAMSGSWPGAYGALALWLDATTLPAGSVAAWSDLSGSGPGGAQTVVNCRPVASLTALGGRPGVVFDGANDFLSLPALALTEYHLFVVLRRDSGATNGTVLQAGASGSEAAVVAVNDDTASGPVLVGSSGRYAKGSCVDAGRARVLRVSATSGGTSPSCFTVADSLQAYTMASLSAPYASAPTASRLGSAVVSGASDRFFTGVISEVILYTSLATGASDTIMRGLAAKWL